MAIEHDSVTSIHRGGYVASSDPGAVGAYRFWTDTTTTPHVLKVRNASNTAWVVVGETLTGSNVGTEGANVFKQKSGQTLEFRKIKGGNILVEQQASEISLTAVESLFNPVLVNGFFREEWTIEIGAAGIVANQTAIVSEFGGMSWTHPEEGIYRGYFTQTVPVGGVSIQVTPGLPALPTTAGLIWSAGIVEPQTVELQVYNISGVRTDPEATTIPTTVSIVIRTTVPFLDNAAGFWGWFTPESWDVSLGGGWGNVAPLAVSGRLQVNGDVDFFSETLNGSNVGRFNYTTNDGFVVSEMSPTTVVIKEVFMVMKMREATFSNSAGILTSEDTSLAPILVGDVGTTKFLDLGYTGQEYRLDNTLYTNNDMQAPMNTWGIVHIRHPIGWGLFEVQIGKDRDFAGRFAEMDVAEVMMFQNLQSDVAVTQIYSYLAEKYDL